MLSFSGYRHIRLLCNTGDIIKNCTLFVHVAITNKRGGGVSMSVRGWLLLLNIYILVYPEYAKLVSFTFNLDTVGHCYTAVRYNRKSYIKWSDLVCVCVCVCVQ